MGGETMKKRLEKALAEQARLAESYKEAMGTPGERLEHVRLEAANLQVALADRAARLLDHAPARRAAR
jgi:hypothetical protein